MIGDQLPHVTTPIPGPCSPVQDTVLGLSSIASSIRDRETRQTQDLASRPPRPPPPPRIELPIPWGDPSNCRGLSVQIREAAEPPGFQQAPGWHVLT